VTGTAPRSAPAQTWPPPSLRGIPTGRPIGNHWYREHGHRPGASDGGCWYYASLPTDPTTGGRFDVPVPAGTCYFANRPLVAALERVGRFTAQHKPVPADLVDGRSVTTIDTVSLPGKAVNLLAKRAATHFGITGELFTMSDYSVPQAWADAIHQAGHQALVYTPRFSPHGRAIAVFGAQGSQPQSTASTQPLGDVLRAAGITIAAIPPASALTFVAPPGPSL
jgi:hypothetical protein